MKFYINGQDLAESYGVQILENGGLDTFFALPKVKEVLNNDWPDEDGKEYDLDAPVKVEAREFRLSVVLLAKDVQDYLVKKTAFNRLILERKTAEDALPSKALTFTSDSFPQEFKMRYRKVQKNEISEDMTFEVIELTFDEIL